MKSFFWTAIFWKCSSRPQSSSFFWTSIFTIYYFGMPMIASSTARLFSFWSCPNIVLLISIWVDSTPVSLGTIWCNEYDSSPLCISVQGGGIEPSRIWVASGLLSRSWTTRRSGVKSPNTLQNLRIHVKLRPTVPLAVFEIRPLRPVHTHCRRHIACLNSQPA